jgi:tetratricopeptide (TPR) repeat protein
VSMTAAHQISKGMSGRKLAVIVAALAWSVMVAGPTRLAAQQNPTDRLIRSLQSRVKMYPQDYAGYDQLGAAYIQKGRETGDATYYELAKASLGKSLDLVNNDPAAASAKTHMAVVAMAEHRFEDALKWSEDALALGSGDPSPWAIVGDAHTDLGQYDEAQAAYAKLRDLKQAGGPVSGISYERDTRLAYLRFISGDPQGAVELMRNAIRTAMVLHMPAENIAWSDYQLGEICFKSGDLTGAEQAYEAGLGVDPTSYRNLAGLAEVRTAQRRYQDAIDLDQRAVAAIPYPMFAASLYDLYLKVGRPADAKKQNDLIEFIGNLNPINQRLFYRDLALFYADHDLKLKESLELAQDELKVRQDIYTWDIMAWVLYKNGQTQEAEAAIGRALRMGTKDALLYFHAGVIYRQLGDGAKAGDYLGKALATNRQFHIFYADDAAKMVDDRKQMAAGGQDGGR